MCNLGGASHTTNRVLFSDINHKVAERLNARLQQQRMKYVVKKEKTIVFGTRTAWKDVEADEAVFGKGPANGDEGEDARNSVAWEQWAGIVERGRRDTLVLKKTNSKKTIKKAPGPGAITRVDWLPLANRYLKGRRVVLHTDRAKSYAIKVEGVAHDSVRHCKKRVKRNGKWVWLKPTYVRLTTHRLPGGATLRTKAGSQIIDRAWGFIRKILASRVMTPGSASAAAAIRSAQWLYWNRGQDLWKQTGMMLKANNWH